MSIENMCHEDERKEGILEEVKKVESKYNSMLREVNKETPESLRNDCKKIIDKWHSNPDDFATSGAGQKLGGFLEVRETLEKQGNALEGESLKKGMQQIFKEMGTYGDEESSLDLILSIEKSVVSLYRVHEATKIDSKISIGEGALNLLSDFTPQEELFGKKVKVLLDAVTLWKSKNGENAIPAEVVLDPEKYLHKQELADLRNEVLANKS